MEKRCKKCRRVIIEEWEIYLINNPNQAWIQCPYCYAMEEIE